MSKRLRLKDKYRIQKRAQNREKKVLRNGDKQLKKDVGIPNMCPFKDALLEQMIRQKRFDREDKVKLAERQKALQSGALVNVAAQAAIREEIFEETPEEELKDAQQIGNLRELSQFKKELNQVVREADVIIQVLDARDPMSCRSETLENAIRSLNKQLIFVLNKIDLAPQESVIGWINYLSETAPTFPFKAATNVRMGRAIGYSKSGVAGSVHATHGSAIGANELLQAIKNFTVAIGGVRQTITVGVVGFPNTGKSSIINSLCRRRCVDTAPIPGFTRQLTTVALDSTVNLIDSPGVVTGQAELDVTKNVLLNTLRVEKIENPDLPCRALYNRVHPEALMQIFNLPRFETYEQFLALIADTRIAKKSGGILDLTAACRWIVQQWNSGKIPFYVPPPKIQEYQRPAEEATGPVVVQTFAPTFDIDALLTGACGTASNYTVFN